MIRMKWLPTEDDSRCAAAPIEAATMESADCRKLMRHGDDQVPRISDIARTVLPVLSLATLVGTLGLDMHIHAGHTHCGNPSQYCLVRLWACEAMLLILRLSGIRNQWVSGSSPLAGSEDQ